MKLKRVSKNCDKKADWLFWAKEAFRASYGYEWQGDNVLLARENLLYTFIDYYRAKFKQRPALSAQEEFAEIISWNIFQMDGLKYVVPMSCHHENKVIIGAPTLFGKIPSTRAGRGRLHPVPLVPRAPDAASPLPPAEHP